MRLSSFLAALAIVGATITGAHAQKQPYEVGISPEGRAYAKGHLLVGFKAESMPALSKGSRLFGGTVEVIYPDIRAALLIYPQSTDVFDLAKLVGSNPGVRYAEPDHIVYADFVPNDTYWAAQQWGPKMINCQAAWDVGTGDPGTVIAIVDTGVDYNHPDLSGKVILGYDYYNNDANPMDDHGHGTHCAGITAASTNNATGIAGVGYNCKVMAVKVLGAGGSGTWSAVASGITYAKNNGAKIISMSLGATAGDATTQAAIDDAWNSGVVVCAAAGNNGSSSFFYPAWYSNCIAIGATNSADGKAYFSNYGTNWVDVAAPGETIWSTYLGSYANLSGTSMACPHVAGACGLIYSALGSTRSVESATSVRNILQNNCDPVLTTYFTFGRINIGKAMQQFAGKPIQKPVQKGQKDFTIPDVTALTPSSMEASTGPFVLTVDGARFRNTDTVRWTAGGVTTTLATSFISASRLTAAVPGALIYNMGSATIDTRTAQSKVSNGMTFTITTDVPAINSLSPNNTLASGPDFVLTVNGVRFRTGDIVEWTKSGVKTQLQSTFVSSAMMTAVVPAALIVNSGTATVTVKDAKNQVSNGVSFTVTPDPPILNSVSPATTTACGPAYEMTLTGSRFKTGNVVYWSGPMGTIALATTYLSATQLRATVPASAIADSGTAAVYVLDTKGQASGQVYVTIANPVPTLSSLSPMYVLAGDPSFTLTLTGGCFTSSSYIVWQDGVNQIYLGGTRLSSTQMQVLVSDALIDNEANINVIVVNPSPGGGSAQLPLIVAGDVNLTSISPSAVVVNTAFQMTLTGTGFLPGTNVLLNAITYQATFVSDTTLLADLPASAVSALGDFDLEVVRPDGQIGGPKTLSVGNPVPAVTSISPSSAAAGGPSFTLTVNGSGFVPGSTIRWNGSSLTTTYVSSTTLTATVSASRIANPGTFTVTVRTSAPGGGTSNGLTFTVN